LNALPARDEKAGDAARAKSEKVPLAKRNEHRRRAAVVWLLTSVGAAELQSVLPLQFSTV
jgi:hypothetical protein